MRLASRSCWHFHADGAILELVLTGAVVCLLVVAIGTPTFGNVAPLVVGLALTADIFAGEKAKVWSKSHHMHGSAATSCFKGS